MPDPTPKPVPIHGIGLDAAGRCTHYHKHCDVVALLCARCGRYYACYECHNTLESHPFAATGEETAFPVVCGECRTPLTREQYLLGCCPVCGIEFNPRCKLHHDIYFK